MNNNDILRNLRYAFDFNDWEMIDLFALAGITVSREQVSNWMKKDDDADFQVMRDKEMAYFLNGLIIEKRGKKEGEQPAAEQRLNNNIVLRKLKIALNLKDEDILEILESAGKYISKHELSAFFRKPGQPQYRVCHDQILRNFLTGLHERYRKG